MSGAGGGGGGPTYSGHVKGFSLDTGYGFIESPEAHASYGKDIIFFKTSVTGYFVKKGDPVTFTITVGQKGPTASQVEMLANPATYLGKVKSFNLQKGWGLIQCEATEKIYGKDVFMLKTALGNAGVGVQPGEMLRFSVQDTERGPSAVDARAVASMGNQCGERSKAAGGGSMPMGGPRQASPPTFAGSAGRLFYGSIKTFNVEKGWGMIACQESQAMYGKDMFVLKTSLEGGHANPGDEVQFTIGFGQKGPQAENVQPAGAAQAAAGMQQARSSQRSSPPTRTLAGTDGQVYSGVIKSYSAEKGWGFIACGETSQLYGKDMFLQRSALEGHAPNQGEEVSFSVKNGLKGPEATNVSFNMSFGDGMVAAVIPTAGFEEIRRVSPY